MREAHRISDLLTAPLIGRIYFIGLGALAILWAAQIFPTVWRDSALEKIANQIIRGYPFKVNDLLEFVPIIDDVEHSTICRPASVRSAAVIRLRLTEEAIKATDRAKIDKTLDDLIVSIRNSLQCAPADSFLWLVLYWAENTRNGFNSRYLDFLRLSYKLGPYEGWVALRRSEIALALFEHLPPAVAEQALAEFVGLVNSWLYHEAAEIFVGPGWRLREKILPRLKAVDISHRIYFEREVYQLGYDVEVPGVEQPEARPWRR
jgi:hypothetical protein